MPAIILVCVYLCIDLVMALAGGCGLSSCMIGFMMAGAAGFALLWLLFVAGRFALDRLTRNRIFLRRFLFGWGGTLLALPVVAYVSFQITSGDGISASSFVWPLRIGIVLAGTSYAWAAARFLPATENRLVIRIVGVACLLLTGAAILAAAQFEPVAYAEAHRVLMAVASLVLAGAFAIALPVTIPQRSRLVTGIAAVLVVVVFLSGLAMATGADRRDEAMSMVWRHTLIARQWQYPIARFFAPDVTTSNRLELDDSPPVPKWSDAAFKGRNVVVVVMDAFRDDRIGKVIGGKPLTPNISRIAGNGLRFHGIADYTYTLGAIRSIQVGSWNVPVSDLGLKTTDHGPRPQWPTAAELFKAQGYETAGFFHSDWRFGPDSMPGFDTHKRPRGDCNAIVREFGDYLAARESGRPLFAWLHLYDAHSPSKLGKRDRKFGNGKTGLYNASICKVDRCIGRLEEQLKKRGLADNTVLVLTADHGEALGEHKRILRHSTCYAHDSRVPMVFHIPWVNESRSIDHYFQSVDLVPTMASLFGLDLGRNQCTGRDLSGFFRPDFRKGSKGYGWAFSEGHSKQYPCVVLNWEGWRMIYNVKSGAYELYDSEGDPDETRNLIGAMPDIASRMIPLVDEFRLRERPDL